MSVGALCFLIAFLVALCALIGIVLGPDVKAVLIWGLFMALGHLLSGVTIPAIVTKA